MTIRPSGASPRIKFIDVASVAARCCLEAASRNHKGCPAFAWHLIGGCINVALRLGNHAQKMLGYCLEICLEAEEVPGRPRGGSEVGQRRPRGGLMEAQRRPQGGPEEAP